MCFVRTKNFLLKVVINLRLGYGVLFDFLYYGMNEWDSMVV